MGHRNWQRGTGRKYWDRALGGSRRPRVGRKTWRQRTLVGSGSEKLVGGSNMIVGGSNMIVEGSNMIVGGWGRSRE